MCLPSPVAVVSTSGEKQARHDLGAVAGQYRPGNGRPALPELTPDSSLSNFLAFALLNSPAVEAAFYDWSASVENITVTRSLPDPQLTFQAYIQDTITSLMPGLAWNFPAPASSRRAPGSPLPKARANISHSKAPCCKPRSI